MSDEQKTNPSVPVRRVNVSSKKEESNAVSNTDTSDVDKGGANKRAESLAKAREAKRLKKQAKHVTVDVPTPSETSVVDNSVDDSDDELVYATVIPKSSPRNTQLPAKKRRAISAAVSRSVDSEDETEEPPRKKFKTTAKTSDDSSFRTFILDKVIDVTKLAAASGVASIGFVVLKGLAGSQLTEQKSVGGFSSDWVKQ